MFSGESLRVALGADGIAEVCFDRRNEAVNKFDVRTVNELQAATQAIAANPSVKGVLVTSAKDVFIVGADIFEFTALFAKTPAEIAVYNAEQSAVFTAFEDLSVPIVTMINGIALGGGFEMTLASDYRVMADTAIVGLPEVNLGLFPGFGGSVRLPRLIGAAPAMEWITSGKAQKAPAALASGAVDAVAPLAELKSAALAKLAETLASGEWKQRRAARNGAVANIDAAAVAAIKATAAKTAKHYPAAFSAVELIENAASLPRDGALKLEAEAFSRIATTPTASALVQLFINDQLMKKKAKGYIKAARKTQKAAVLGAGIMGGGISYTSAVQGVPVLMKDIAQPALELGTGEARKLLAKQVANGRMKQDKADAVLASITPQLDFAGFDTVDVVVEAVVENLKIKKIVLAEVEQKLKADAVIASNTSSLSIGDMASALQRPENFVGMHFFNPVPVMPLVEVIRGPNTSEVAASTIAAYGLAMGKTPVVVKDCPGFLVNRILTAQFVGFLKLLRDGADFEQVDRVMEDWGLPMGPAYLQDVIGMDTSAHVVDVISAGYPERMRLDFKSAVHHLVDNKRYGQKTGMGFYKYEADAKGRPAKLPSPEAHELVAQVQANGKKTFSDEEIIDRMMLPMTVEAAHALEDKVADTAAEIDMSLILGVGFPRHRGGALKFADQLGLGEVVKRCERYTALGGGYVPTARMRAMAASGGKFFG